MNVREQFLEFFQEKNHKLYESAPLTPEDASLLFVNAGMVPFKNIFTGEIPTPTPPRATSCQTCIRAGGKHNDLENVGYTRRHHTMFEMLGNFSFGDYFKAEAIDFAWEFVTKRVALPVDKLWVTIHDSDDEAYELWQKHIDKSRIKRFGDKDNFWQMGDTGPCGPCSEIFYDQGSEHFNSEEDYLGGEGDRFLEIWNLVFMQYERDSDGTLNPLPKPSIDTGMGLERITAIKEGVYSNYDSSLFMPIINRLAKLADKTYDYESGASFRVIADHIRAVSFLVAQGIRFDKEGRGYVLRRILRRAVRHGYLLGFREPFLYKLVEEVGALMGSSYGYIRENKSYIAEQIKLEEERFFKTIDSGMKLFNEELAQTKETFNGEVAFKLYDSYGFPLDLTVDMLRDKGLKLDEAGFERLMSEQKERSKASWSGSGDSLVSGDFKALLEEFGLNCFVGYSQTKTTSKVLALLDSSFKRVDVLDGEGWVLLDETPFYAQSGGQCGDSGTLGDAKVLDTKKFFELNLSNVQGSLRINQSVEACVDDSRAEIAKHHSATHLLHAMLREVLGEHIAQAGSLVEPTRLRFDFSHPKAMSSEEINEVEKRVNALIVNAIAGRVEEKSIEEAKAQGAMALFGEKYGDSVRVVSFDSASIELCGGTHVENTALIGNFIITKEGGVSAGVRRIEALCGKEALSYINDTRAQLVTIKEALKSQAPLDAIAKLKEELKALKEELKSALKSGQKELQSTMITQTKVVVDVVEGGDIKEIIDNLKNQHESIAIMLFQVKGDKVLIASGAKGTSIKAGDWVKTVAPIVGGGGGGRPDFAQAGGKDASKIDEALQASREYVASKIA